MSAQRGKKKETPQSDAGRIRFVETEVTRGRGSRLRVRVTVEHGGETFAAESESVGLEAVELRCGATATLRAIGQAMGGLEFQLVGIKRLHAFDADVILVCLRDPEVEGQRLIGAVPVRTTAIDGAVAAVLNATNRLLDSPSGAAERR